ncbi:FAD binding domain protein [Aspergillus indologenus CBS 114.80]|uniref:Delta(24)-sterol reductase n=1 Tax=Aspergillus indologenus CBS 114.80 TaxID=1450541 RepID=A0A2V5IMM1_9EURO|nr:FAD binding domain protein [Aspergillus indologenus CBS 114.80]
MEAHKTAVDALAAQVKRFHARQQPFRIYHGSTNSTRQSQHHAHNTISTADLNHVLHVNEVTQTVTVEPNVPMDALVAATLEHGLVPLVVMEFPGITAGGGFSGTSGESSSFRHGFFDATVLQIEIVIPNGEIRSASRTGPTADLFWGAASAFGTLGVVTMLEIQCRPARPFVELTYLSTTSMTDAMATIRAATADPTVEYLDGIVYAQDHIVICAGKLTDASSPAPIQQFTRPHDPWFYLHAQSRAPRSSSPPKAPAPKDHIPLQDYLFRYDRGAFWTGRYAYAYFLTPFTHLTRYLLDSFMRTRVMYHALHQSGLAAQYLIQDVAVPYAAVPTFLDWLDASENFGHYPIWLCPLRVREEGGGLMTTSGRRRSQTQTQAPAQTQTPTTAPQDKQSDAEDEDDQYLVNFGLWAPSPYRGAAFIDQNRRLERTVHALGGKKWLYAHAYYTEDEFWEIYDWDRYRGLRERYHAAYLPDLFEKVRVRRGGQSETGDGVGWGTWGRGLVGRVWPVRGLYGVWRAWWGGEYYLKD